MLTALATLPLLFLPHSGLPEPVEVNDGPRAVEIEAEIRHPDEQSEAQQSADTASAGSENNVDFRMLVCKGGGAGHCVEVLPCGPDGEGKTYELWSNEEGFLGRWCSASPERGQQVTPGRVLRALEEVPIAPAKVHIQPPNGKTLVNLDTNFFTTAAPFTETVRLLGQRVDLRIKPATYRWDHGDGTSQTTKMPGAKYPDLDVVHAYERTGDVAVSVEVTWSATFRVNGGAWREVPGTVTIDGPSVPLRIVEAKPLLTDAGN